MHHKNYKRNLFNKKVTACFTGHRPQNLSWKFNEQDERCVEMKRKLKNEIIKSIESGYSSFISGMALGFDMICAETILELKEIYPNLRLICVLPCKDQSKLWKDNQIKRYQKILIKSDFVYCLYDDYKDGCMLERNDFMLSNSSLVIALYNGKCGGTEYTIKRAKDKGLKIWLINP